MDLLRTLAQFGMQIEASARTARRVVVERGELPFYRIGGRVMVKQSDIDIWIEAHRNKGTEEPSSLKYLVARAVQRARQRRLGS